MNSNSSIKGFCLILTGECNFNCNYCMQVRTSSEIDRSVIDESLSKLLVLVEARGYISFYGGEPLICFDKLKYVVERVAEVREDIKFSLTTNGSLLNSEIIELGKL